MFKLYKQENHLFSEKHDHVKHSHQSKSQLNTSNLPAFFMDHYHTQKYL